MILTDESLKTVPAKNLVNVTGYLTPDEKQKLKEWAEQDGRNLSNLVAHILRKALEAHERENGTEE